MTKKKELMKKINKFQAIAVLILILNSCGTLKEGFNSQKKNSIDEFLVEKKSPLVMPPDFNELPLPEDPNQISTNVEETGIKSLITDNREINNDNQSDVNKSTNFENSIIDKIKNN